MAAIQGCRSVTPDLDYAPVIRGSQAYREFPVIFQAVAFTVSSSPAIAFMTASKSGGSPKIMVLMAR